MPEPSPSPTVSGSSGARAEPAPGPGTATVPKDAGMTPFIVELIRPYRGWLAIVFAAMLVQTAMSLAGPWPIKVIIDNVVSGHPLPDWLHWLRDLPVAKDKMGLAVLAALATVLIAAIGALASYIDNYYTESVGQWVAHDLRVRVYDHLHRLSLTFYDHQQTGPLLSTITSDVATVQNFASSATLGIVVDLLTIVMMLGLMFWLNWDFALIAVGVTPFLLLFVMRFKKSVKSVTHEVRKKQADIVAVVQQGLESVRVGEGLRAAGPGAGPHGRGEPRAGRRGAQGKTREVAAVAGRDGRGGDVHRHRALARRRADSRRRDDRRRADRLSRVPQQVLQAGPGPGEDDQLDRAGGGRPGADSQDPRYRHRHPRTRRTRGRCRRAAAR